MFGSQVLSDCFHSSHLNFLYVYNKLVYISHNGIKKGQHVWISFSGCNAKIKSLVSMPWSWRQQSNFLTIQFTGRMSLNDKIGYCDIPYIHLWQQSLLHCNPWTSSWQGSKQTSNLAWQQLVRGDLNSLVVWPKIYSNVTFSLYQLKN